jgi:hypothetical protein
MKWSGGDAQDTPDTSQVKQVKHSTALAKQEGIRASGMQGGADAEDASKASKPSTACHSTS